MSTEFRVLHPLEYGKSFLENEKRPDGRGFNTGRPTLLNVGPISTAEGSAVVKIGRTTMMCGIKGELVEPKHDDPDKGYIITNVEIPPLCSSSVRPGPPSKEVQALNQIIFNLLRDSRCLNLEDLCISKGKVVWVLFCDLICLDYDGNPLDAAVIALFAALLNVTLPTVTICENDKINVNLSIKKPLSLLARPQTTTFAIVDEYIIMDPTREEEGLCSGTLVISTLANGELCLLHKAGGVSISATRIQECIDSAKNRNQEIRKLIDKVLKSSSFKDD